jgi:uncharacterized membrane protein
MEAKPKISSVNRWLANVMVAGVCVSAVLCGLGLMIALGRDDPRAPLKPFAGVAEGLNTPWGVLAAAGKLEPAGLMALGVLVLIATPVIRVGFALVGFVIERDRVYIVVTSIVLALLACGLFFGMVD